MKILMSNDEECFSFSTKKQPNLVNSIQDCATVWLMFPFLPIIDNWTTNKKYYQNS